MALSYSAIATWLGSRLLETLTTPAWQSHFVNVSAFYRGEIAALSLTIRNLVVQQKP